MPDIVIFTPDHLGHDILIHRIERMVAAAGFGAEQSFAVDIHQENIGVNGISQDGIDIQHPGGGHIVIVIDRQILHSNGYRLFDIPGKKVILLLFKIIGCEDQKYRADQCNGYQDHHDTDGIVF